MVALAGWMNRQQQEVISIFEGVGGHILHFFDLDPAGNKGRQS